MDKQCAQCKKLLSDDYVKIRCEECLDYQRDRQQKIRDSQPPKVCRVCGTNSPIKNRKICKDCFQPVPKNNARLQRIAANLCIDCGEPRNGKTFRCNNCVLKIKEMDRLTRIAMLSNNICPVCKENSIDLELQQMMCRECRNQINEQNTRRKATRLAAGLCRICGTEPANERTACETCMLKNNAKRYLGDRNKWMQLKDILEKQNYRCVYTNIPLVVGRNASIDHIIAKSKGGQDAVENFQWVHLWINKMKNDKPHDEFVVSLRLFLQESSQFVLTTDLHTCLLD